MYSEIFELHAELLKALAHPRRLEILHLLREQELPVTDIHTMLDLPQANISQHLTILREAGVVKCRRDGKQMFYSVSNKKIIKANDLLRAVLIEQRQELKETDRLLSEITDSISVVHDPVCQMRLLPQTAGFHCKQGKKIFYFCASGCLKKFQESPERYV